MRFSDQPRRSRRSSTARFGSVHILLVRPDSRSRLPRLGASIMKIRIEGTRRRFLTNLAQNLKSRLRTRRKFIPYVTERRAEAQGAISHKIGAKFKKQVEDAAKIHTIRYGEKSRGARRRFLTNLAQNLKKQVEDAEKTHIIRYGEKNRSAGRRFLIKLLKNF